MTTTFTHAPITHENRLALLSLTWKPVRYLRNDPRTTLFIVAAINAVVMGSASTPVLIAASLLVGFLFASVATGRGVLTFVILEGVFLLFTSYGAFLGTQGFVAFMVGMSFWMARFTLTVTIGIYAIYSMSVARLAAALYDLRLPRSLVSAILVMLRFVPTVFAGFKAIQEAMKLRGIQLMGRDVIIHPLKTVQYLIVPLLAGVLRIADDLTASAVIRGLGGPQRPRPLCGTSMGVSDAVLIVITTTLIVVRICNPDAASIFVLVTGGQ